MKRARPPQSKLPYPLVACSHHNGDPLPGYVVCVHALDEPELPVRIDRATATNLGAVLCTVCSGDADLPVELLKTVCVHVVAEKFGVEP